MHEILPSYQFPGPTGSIYPSLPRYDIMVMTTMTAASRRPRAALGLLLAVLAASGRAAAVPAHAQEQPPALFSAIPEGAQAPPSLDARSAYMVDSEMVVIDTAELL